jgi:hypothetical protein
MPGLKQTANDNLLCTDLNLQRHELVVPTTNRSNNHFKFHKSYLLHKKVLIILSPRYVRILYKLSFYTHTTATIEPTTDCGLLK